MPWCFWSSKDKRANNTQLVLGGTAGIRIKWLDDRKQGIQIEKVQLRYGFFHILDPAPIGHPKKQEMKLQVFLIRSVRLKVTQHK